VNFIYKLEQAQEYSHSLVSVGLDPDNKRVEPVKLFQFNRYIVKKTAQYTCCFKLQLAYFLAYGVTGLQILVKTVNFIKLKYPHIPIILDAKVADIENTSIKYSQFIFDYLKVDACTVNPYLGYDALKPFFARSNKGIIILCKTSNKDSKDFQHLKSKTELYLSIAKKVKSWNQIHKNLLLVVGATWPSELKKIRKITKKEILLVPGIGEQKGNLNKVLTYGLRKDKKGLIIHSSRSIIYADNPAQAAKKLRDEINNYR